MKKYIVFFVLIALTLTVCVSASNTPMLAVADMKAVVGQTVTVEIAVEDNPGFACLQFGLEFDSSIFILQSVELGLAADTCVYTPVETANKNGLIEFVYADIVNTAGDGVLATLQFFVSEIAALDTYSLTVYVDEDAACYYDGQDEIAIDFVAKSGSIAVGALVYGDVDLNGIVNVRDAALLQQYLALWDVNINLDVADVTSDGRINARDVAHILQYIAGWDVILGSDDSVPPVPNVNFAVVTTDPEIMADLLDMTVTKYEKALIGAASTEDASFDGGLYLNNDYVVVAMLNFATGAWELANIEAVALNYANQVDEGQGAIYDFTHYVDVATIASYTKITSVVAGIEEYITAANLLTSANLFMVVEEDDGVYTLASVDTYDAQNEEYFVECVENANGLIFNSVGRTNAITASPDVDAARVSTNENTVVVAIADDGTVAVRTGVQGTKKSLDQTVTYYAADASLIVLTTDTLPTNWGTGSALAFDATYYVVLPDVAIEYGTTENEDEYSLTIEGLFNLKTLEVAEHVVLLRETIADLEDVADLTEVVGTVLFMDADGEMVVADMSIEAALQKILAEEDDDYFAATVVEFVDGESITVNDGTKDVTTAAKAIAETNITVVTLDLTGYDWDEAETDTMYVDGVSYVEDAYEGISSIGDNDEWYNYVLDMSDVVAEISDPTDGVYDQFIIDMAGKTIKVQDADADEGVYDDNYNFTVELNTVALYDDDTEILTLYVVKLIK